MHRIALILCLVSLSALAAEKPADKVLSKNHHPSMLERSVPRPVAIAKLRELRRVVHRLAAQGKRPLVVFDIDDTVVDSSKFKGVAHEGGPRRGPAKQLRQLIGVDGSLFDGGPIRGAPSYVNSILKAGGTVIYLSGRTKPMGPGTKRQFERDKLPMGKTARFMFNPKRQWAIDWKASVKPKLLAMGTPIGFFDNERENLRLFRKQYPDAMVFRLNTKSSYRDTGRGIDHIVVIDDYRTR